jgi:hypothetical protein
MTLCTDADAKKRSIDALQLEKDVTVEHESSGSLPYSASVDVDAFIAKFAAAPKGTVSAWLDHADKSKRLIDTLEALVANKSLDNDKKKSSSSQFSVKSNAQCSSGPWIWRSTGPKSTLPWGRTLMKFGGFKSVILSIYAFVQSRLLWRSTRRKREH